MYFKESLHTLKTNLQDRETTLRTIQHHYPHLAHLSENEILKYLQIDTMEELGEHIRETLKSSMAIYADRVDGKICSCKDSKGNLKDPYDTQELAQQKASEQMMMQQAKLRVYPCPYGNGWHLTKV